MPPFFASSTTSSTSSFGPILDALTPPSSLSFSTSTISKDSTDAEELTGDESEDDESCSSCSAMGWAVEMEGGEAGVGVGDVDRADGEEEECWAMNEAMSAK